MIHLIKITMTLAIATLGGCHSNKRSGKYQPTKPFTFVQLCDTQLGMGGYEHDIHTFKQAVKQINHLKPDFAVICGDLVNTPNSKSFADFIAIKNTLIVKCYCAPGNHDVENNPTVASLEKYRKIIGQDYYSIEHKGYTFIITNTQLWKAPLEGESKKHHDWVIETLKKCKAKGSPVFIVCHYPLYLSSPDEEENYANLPLPIRKKLLKLYEDNNVIAIVSGHTHRAIINNYKNIQMVSGETTSRNFDGRSLGFRLWNVSSPESLRHIFVPLLIHEQALSDDGVIDLQSP